MKKTFAFIGTGFLASLVGAARLVAAGDVERVGVSAEADEAYVQLRQTAEGLREETYIFAQGQFFPGESTESSLLTIPFERMVEPLAHGLARQNFYPTSDQESADLLITVHWGVTKPARFDEVVEEDVLNRTQDALDNQPEDPALIDYGLMNELSATQENISSGVDQEVMENARMLGYLPIVLEERKRSHQAGRGNAQTPTAKLMAMERYFIILTAWDNQLIQSSGERQLRWVVRCNLPALGHRFADAVPALIRVGSEYYGRNLRTPVTVRTNLGPGRVKVTEPGVIGIED